ncbi:MAG: L,D-transpeptidase [Butyricicoccus sp.]
MNTGVGLHDATWRSTFGGSYYLGSGSHGCVNMPLSTAKFIFNNFADGTPVIVHYN